MFHGVRFFRLGPLIKHPQVRDGSDRISGVMTSCHAVFVSRCSWDKLLWFPSQIVYASGEWIDAVQESITE